MSLCRVRHASVTRMFRIVRNRARDSGRGVRTDGTGIPVASTVEGEGDENLIHVAAEGSAMPAPGETVTARLDWERRYAHMRMHTCLHLLCAAVPYGVTGGKIGADKSSLDFDIGDGSLDKPAIEAEINRLVAAARPVGARWVDEAELDANPALGRTMCVRPPRGAGSIRLLEISDVDLQPCGGTHLVRTGEVGRVQVGKIENKGKRNRRVNIILSAV